MNENEFQPFTPQLGISGSSYQLQMGQVNGLWAIRLVKGTSVLASKIFKDTPNPEELPLGRYLTGWVLSVLAIPNINTYQIQKVVGFIRKKALETYEEHKEIRHDAGKSERHDVKLQKVPENVPIKRPHAAGWVKDEKSKVEPTKGVELSAALAASNRSASDDEGHHVTIGKRKLPEIPRGEGFVIKSLKTTMVSAQSSTGQNRTGLDSRVLQQSIINSPDFQHMLERIEKIEQRVLQLENENQTLRKQLEL